MLVRALASVIHTATFKFWLLDNLCDTCIVFLTYNYIYSFLPNPLYELSTFVQIYHIISSYSEFLNTSKLLALLNIKIHYVSYRQFMQLLHFYSAPNIWLNRCLLAIKLANYELVHYNSKDDDDTLLYPKPEYLS